MPSKTAQERITTITKNITRQEHRGRLDKDIGLVRATRGKEENDLDFMSSTDMFTSEQVDASHDSGITRHHADDTPETDILRKQHRTCHRQFTIFRQKTAQ